MENDRIKRNIREITLANVIFAKEGVSCLYESEELNSIFVHLMKLSAKNSRLRKYEHRCMQS